MADLVPRLNPVNIEDEMKRSYMDYAMSVIIGRALPDARDGLKPAHRRVLYGMKTMGLSATRGYRKCAKIVGEVMGNFHPHGDASIYDTLVRMAQDFNMRYPLVDGQGNYGSIDGDPPAAMRYTEARLQALADDLRALAVPARRRQPHRLHAVQHAAMGGLEPVARVGQRSSNDHAHRVIHVRPLHFVFDIDRVHLRDEVCHM